MKKTEKNIYLQKQILTYMGNKRKLINNINDIISLIENDFGEKLTTMGEGFSGTGVVSRLLKTRCKKLYVNDIAGYSRTLNECYLTNLSSLTDSDKNKIKHHIDVCNQFMLGYNFANFEPMSCDFFISKYWAANDDKNIKEGERVFFTKNNACRIDRAMTYINNFVEDKYRSFLLAPLLVESSIHNNTNGQFSAFFKDKNKKIGMFGGKNNIDIKRITGEIKIQEPLLLDTGAEPIITQLDTNEWIKNIEPVDLIYYDPPYNKHPYNIYYFLLDIINNWDTSIDIPDTNRGQPKNWIKSPWCSFSKAKNSFIKLIEDTKIKTKFLLLSYNNTGIIPIKDLEDILIKHGIVYKIPIEHKTYNKLKGIASYKRKKSFQEVKEFIWLVDFR